MPKHTTQSLTWCHERQGYEVRDPEHTGTLATAFVPGVSLTPESREWYDWLGAASSFAFIGREGRFTARKEARQRGDAYWVAYQRVNGKLQKKYLGKACELTASKLEDAARAILVTRSTSPCSTPSSTPISAPSVSPHAWSTISEEVMGINIGRFPQGLPYDDAPWLLDRSHAPLVEPTTERCIIHPTACWLRRDPRGQAWCTSPTCWRRYNLMRLGGLLQFRCLLGYGWDTRIEPGEASWSAYAQGQDDEHIAFSLRQAMTFCCSLGLQLPDLSDHARMHSPVYDAWK